MDYTFLPHANSLLIDYCNAILYKEDFYLVSNLNANPPGYTIVLREFEDGYTPKRVTESGSMGFILHYQDFMTPRPFDREHLKVTFLLPDFTGFEIFEISPVHTVLVVRVDSDFGSMLNNVIRIGEDTPLCHVTWGPALPAE